MRRPFTNSWVVFFVIISCKKTNTEPNTPPPNPPVKDTPKVENSDTLYLRKTEKTYLYDATGTIILDSTFSSWTYDAQRRVTVFTQIGYGVGDSMFNSYDSIQNTS